jgi:uncharacterized protein
MAEYLAPGVYVEEVPSAVKPIGGVGTSTAGLVGVVTSSAVEPTKEALPYRRLREPIGTYNSGTEVTEANVDQVVDAAKERSDPKALVQVEPLTAVNQARLCTNFSEFVRYFGGFTATNPPQNTLAHAIYGFFTNGGTRCWVVRASTLDVGNVRAALTQLELIDEIALVAVPGATGKDMQQEILNHCQQESLQDRFAILDGQQTTDPSQVSNISDNLANSSYGALYFPWITAADPNTRTTVVPPSGHIAGVYARVDTTRGVHKAPANEVIRGALDVAVAVSKEQQAGLNPNGINVLRKFDGNIMVWGARTWAKEPEWRYINVRRLFLYLRKSIDQGTQWVVFEPNDPGLWAKIQRNVTAFLTNVWRAGALFGATPQEAFYVKCDAETNPPELRDLGRVVTEVGIAVVKPAEFVVFRISQWAGPGGA